MDDFINADKEARRAVREFRKTLPKAIRPSVTYLGYALHVGPGIVQVEAKFFDENGPHRILLNF